jgi:hypothetical protein
MDGWMDGWSHGGCFQRAVLCLRRVQDEWAVCKVINKDLAGKAGQQQMAPPPHAVSVGMERSDSLAFLDDLVLDNADDLPPLVDSTTYAAGSLFAAAGTTTTTNDDSGGYQQATKAEPQPQLPAPSNSPYQHQQQAIRRHCKAEAPAPAMVLSPSRETPGADMFQLQHVDELLQLDGGFMEDYYNMNMWKV